MRVKVKALALTLLPPRRRDSDRITANEPDISLLRKKKIE